MQSRFDHGVFAVQDLSVGQEYWQDKFGFQLPVGGQHPRMGTHNLLTATGQNQFLEMIAIDPQAPAPSQPRWFNLDDSIQHQRSAVPSPLTWVVATDDIAQAVEAAKQAGFPVGNIIEMTRGDLRWLITVRPDGKLVENGCFPILIEWPRGLAHPAGQMTDCQIRYQVIRLCHPQPERLRQGLKAIGADQMVEILSAPIAHIAFDLMIQETPILLSSHLSLADSVD